MLGAETSGAEVESFPPSLNSEGNGMNVRYPSAVSTAFRMADIMPKLGDFST